MVGARETIPSGGSLPTTTLATAPGSRSTPVPSPAALPPHSVLGKPAERLLSDRQVEAIRSAMKLFVEDDVARGLPRSGRIYCDACQQARPAAGVIEYDRYVMCNRCAIEYEVGRARGLITTPGQYVRDKHFGDGDFYLLSD